jgi:hypothetical protein
LEIAHHRAELYVTIKGFMKSTWHHHLQNSIALVLITLFTYAATDKLLHLRGFMRVLKASPLLNHFVTWLPWLIIAAEYLVVTCLLITPLRLAGLLGAFALMLLFTGYIGYMLATASSLPCSCGGILKQLSWKTHFGINLLLTMLAAYALRIQIKNSRPQPNAPA